MDTTDNLFVDSIARFRTGYNARRLMTNTVWLDITLKQIPVNKPFIAGWFEGEKFIKIEWIIFKDGEYWDSNKRDFAETLKNNRFYLLHPPTHWIDI